MEYISYIFASVLALILGQVTKHLCAKMPDWVSEKISFKEYLESLKSGYKLDFKYSAIYLILFNLLIYQLDNNAITFIYMFCIFSLTIVFNIDYKYQLIPDECHIIIFMCGIVNLVFNWGQWYSYLLGALIGGGSFYLLGVLAVWIYKKEGMGFGDVKLMAVLGFLFGTKNILVITILSFALAAVISIILIACKKKKIDSYIPFGPFIVIGTILVIYFKPDIFIEGYLTMCSAIGEFFTDIIFKTIK